MKITKRQLRRIIREVTDYETHQKVHWKEGDLVRQVDFEGDEWGGDYEKTVGDQIGQVIEIDKDPDGTQYTVLFPDGTMVMDTFNSFEAAKQLRETLDTHNMDPNRAYELIAILQEFGYQLFLPPAMDSNNIAIDDALGGYPGEFTYEELMTAVRIVQGRGA